MRFAISAALAATLLAPPAVLAQGASFQGLGDLPGGGVSSGARGISADGNTVVGASVSASGPEAFRWTQAGGMQGLGDFAGASFESIANGVSSDGAVVVGTGRTDDGDMAFRWTQAGGLQALGSLGAINRSYGFGISADGIVLVGDAGVNPDAFRWTQSGGIQGIGSLGGSSAAHGVSADGSVIVGRAAQTGVGGVAFRWTQTGGMQSLGMLPGATNASARGVSSDGSVVVGVSGPGAFRWTQAGGMVDIGDLPGGAVFSDAAGVSGDGSVVVGRSFSTTGFEAFIWTPDDGMRSLRDVLVEQGVDMTGWTLSDATAVSPDGRVVVGAGMNPQGQQEAFRATLAGDHRWIDPTGGSWDVASNWNPASIPGPDDPVRFDLDATYTVTGGTALGGATARAMSADDGTVDFELGGLALTSTSPVIPSLTVSFDATAKIIAGTSTFVHGIVGFGSNAPGDTTTTAHLQVFNAGTQLTGSGALLVGIPDGGRGEVFVAGGALRTANGSLGVGAIGEAVVGNDGDWTIDDVLTVGLGQTGRLTIEEGGGVSVRKLILSSSTAAGQAASVAHVAGASPSGERSRLFVTDSLLVGGSSLLSAPARLRIADGASVTTDYMRVGGGSAASVIVGGGVTQGFDAEVTASTILVGSGGSETAIMEMEIRSGGSVETDELFVGHTDSRGTVQVVGLGTLTARDASFAGGCTVGIGPGAEGILGVREGGQVHCDQASVGQFGLGTIFVGHNGGAPAPSRLVVSRVLKIGEGGDPSFLQLAAGEVDAVDAASNPPADPFDIVVFQPGEITGTGFLFGSVDNLGVIAAGVNCVPSCPRVPGREIDETEAVGGVAGGALQIGGRLVLESAGTLAIPLAGPDSTQQGRLRVVAAHGMDGSVALGGTLRLDFQNGYAPQTGDTFLLLDAASTAGVFAGTEVTGLEPGWLFELQIVNGTVVLNSQSNGIPTTPAEPGAPTASRLVLLPPAPNPTTGSSTIRFELPEAGPTRLALYDVLGREVALLVDGERPAGASEATIRAGALAPGIYVVSLVAGGGASTRHLTVAR